MPKIIKKKAKAEKPEQEDLQHILLRARGAAAPYGKKILYSAIAFAVIIISVAGFFFYKKSVNADADKMEYEAHRQYYGLYGAKPLVKVEGIRAALESYKKAYGLRKSAFSLYGIASCQYTLGNFAEAAASLTELNAKFPDDSKYVPLAYYKMALISLKTGKPEEALKSLDVLYNYRTDSFKDIALVESARILEDLGRKGESEEKYKKIAKDFPTSPFFGEAKAKTEGKQAAATPGAATQ